VRPAKRPKAPSREPFQDLVSINGRAGSPRRAGCSRSRYSPHSVPARLSFLIHAPPPDSGRLRVVAAGRAGRAQRFAAT
jgi:hypothetical protein